MDLLFDGEQRLLGRSGTEMPRAEAPGEPEGRKSPVDVTGERVVEITEAVSRSTDSVRGRMEEMKAAGWQRVEQDGTRFWFRQTRDGTQYAILDDGQVARARPNEEAMTIIAPPYPAQAQVILNALRAASPSNRLDQTGTGEQRRMLQTVAAEHVIPLLPTTPAFQVQSDDYSISVAQGRGGNSLVFSLSGGTTAAPEFGIRMVIRGRDTDVAGITSFDQAVRRFVALAAAGGPARPEPATTTPPDSPPAPDTAPGLPVTAGDQAPAEKPDDNTGLFHAHRETLQNFSKVSESKINALKDSITPVLGLSTRERKNMELFTLRPLITPEVERLGVRVKVPGKPYRDIGLEYSRQTGRCIAVRIAGEAELPKEKPEDIRKDFDGTADTLRNFYKVPDAKITALKDTIGILLKLSTAQREAMKLTLFHVRMFSRTEEYFHINVDIKGKFYAAIPLTFSKPAGKCLKAEIKR
jgi:hypothetical protein